MLDFYYSGTESGRLVEKNSSIYNLGCSYSALVCFHLGSPSCVALQNPPELLPAFVSSVPLGLLLL